MGSQLNSCSMGIDANIFFPWGIAETLTAKALGYGLLAIMGQTRGISQYFWQSQRHCLQKCALFRVQEFLSFAIYWAAGAC